MTRFWLQLLILAASFMSTRCRSFGSQIDSDTMTRLIRLVLQASQSR